jgi:hypothetical protein
MITTDSPEAVQVTMSNHLLWQLGFIQDFLWAIFIISLLVIFRDYIERAWKTLQMLKVIRKSNHEIPSWIYTGSRYSILILFTVFVFLSIFNVSLITPSAIAGSNLLTSNVALTTTGLPSQWSNLAGIYAPIAWGFVMYWICSVWLMAFGYLLKYELEWIWLMVKRIPRWIYSFIMADDVRV